MASVMQGDAYNIPVTIKSGNGTLITPEIAACVEIAVGQFAKRWPGQVTFDEKTGEWQFPVTQKQTFRFAPGAAVVQARVVFQDGSIMGGSGAPVSVVQSASRGTLPQPEKTEAVTGSTPKATEVTIPTVHDIHVSLHSQVILSDPIKAPYIGDNGNWYEYDAETGEFVDTGVKAGGGTDPSLGLTAATIGQIIKVKAVDTDGKPTAWKAVDDRLPNVTTNDDGKVLAVRQIAEFEAAYVLEHMPNLNDFIGLGIDNASPGQFAKVKYVDDFGQPTAWEAADMPTGGGGETWEKIAEIELAEAASSIIISQDSDGRPFALKRVMIDCSINIDQDSAMTYAKTLINDLTVCNNVTHNFAGKAVGYYAFYAELIPGSGALCWGVLSDFNYNWAGPTQKMGYKYNDIWKANAITKLTISANDGLKNFGVAGSKINVLGVRA